MRRATATLTLTVAAFGFTACGTDTPAGPGIEAGYFKANASDEAKLDKGCADLFGNPKDVAALHGVTAPGEYEWQASVPDPASGAASCYLRGPDVGNVTYTIYQGEQWAKIHDEESGLLKSDIVDDRFTTANYYRITLSTGQQGKVVDLLNAANGNVK